jgi:hypothetical protein
MGTIQGDDPDFNKHIMKMNVDMDKVKKQVVSKPFSSRNGDLVSSAYSPTGSFINYPSHFGKHLSYMEQTSARVNSDESITSD